MMKDAAPRHLGTIRGDFEHVDEAAVVLHATSSRAISEKAIRAVEAQDFLPLRHLWCLAEDVASFG